MSGAAIVAFGAVSALGEGRHAASAGELGEAARVGIAPDDELRAAGLARPFVARAPMRGDASDRATRVLAHAMDDCIRVLDAADRKWRAGRVGLVLGTSSGGMRVAEQLFATPSFAGDAEAATYFGPLAAVARAPGIAFAPATLVLGACASSTIALGLALRWLDLRACDLVLAGGFDAVSVFVAAGFEVLRATSERIPPAPFRVGRDGMALGEGAAVLALVRAADAPRGTARVYVAGFGASADAVHLTAPDRSGSGLARAVRAALADAETPPDAIDLVSAHATATPFNDAAESRAIAAVLGARAPDVVVHPFKAQIGHTLGAAGALESLACVDAMTRGALPAAAGQGPLDPDAPARLLPVTERGTPKAALKLSSAFGGANAALVLTRDLPSRALRQRRDAFVHRAVHVSEEPTLASLAPRLGWTEDRLGRADRLTLFALAAVADLSARHGSLAGAALVVGHAFATLETNATYYDRILSRGARMAEPRRFPYTSPNAVAGECSLAFGCTGPSFAVGGGLHGGVEALAVAALLVEGGDADRVVVVAVDDTGPAVARLVGKPPFEHLGSFASGAVAVLVARAPEPGTWAVRVRETALARGGIAVGPGPAGHYALLPLVGDTPPAEVLATSPPDALACVRFEPA